MTVQPFLVDALRGAALLGAALAAMPLLRRAPSATRRLVLALALAGALVLPLVSSLAPAWRVEAPAAVTSLRAVVLAERPIDGDPSVAAAPAAASAPRAAPASSLRFDSAALVAIAWALGALVVIARLALGIARSRAMVRRAAPAQGWSNAIARAEAAIGARAQVRVSGDVDAPAVTGVLAPVILVPRASTAWSYERRYAVLLHELAHVRQRDCLAQIVGQLACAAHWFDPLAWIVARRLRLERELAADDAVVTSGARASSYAEDLLAIADASAERAAPAGALGIGERSDLVARVKAIVARDRARRPLGARAVAAVVATWAIVVLGVACATPTTTRTRAEVAASVPAGAPSTAQAAAGSTIDPRVQSIADEELDRAVREWQPEAGVIVVLEPSTGAILASAGRAGGARADVASQRAYVTGSTMKAVTLSAALDDGVLAPDERFDCEHGAWTYHGEVMHDAASNATLTVPEMLAVSTNVGFTKIFDRLGWTRLERAFRAFHFGAAPPIDGAIAGTIPVVHEERSYAGALAAIGEGVQASPLQVAAAYAAIANGGSYVAPTLTPRAGEPTRERLMKPETARLVTSMLEEVVNGERGTGKLARIAGARVAGKTGTAGWDRPDGREGVYASFVGFAPASAPRVVILVGLEQPRDGEGGGKVAAPVFARVASRVLGN